MSTEPTDKQTQIKNLALAYFNAANILQEQHRQGSAKTLSDNLLPIPIGHLTCHGIELALKSNLLSAGVSIGRLASAEFGHNLMKLWRAPENGRLQQVVLDRSLECWIEAKESGLWQQQQDWDEAPQALLERTLGELNDLHTQVTSYALRYGTADGQMIIPKTNLIRNVFERQMLMMWPVPLHDMSDAS